MLFIKSTIAPTGARCGGVACSLYDGQVLSRSFAVLSGLKLIGDLLSFAERPQAGAFYGRDVDESVFGAILRLDEAKSLCWVEEFYSSGGHFLWGPIRNSPRKYSTSTG